MKKIMQVWRKLTSKTSRWFLVLVSGVTLAALMSAVGMGYAGKMLSNVLTFGSDSTVDQPLRPQEPTKEQPVYDWYGDDNTMDSNNWDTTGGGMGTNTMDYQKTEQIYNWDTTGGGAGMNTMDTQKTQEIYNWNTDGGEMGPATTETRNPQEMNNWDKDAIEKNNWNNNNEGGGNFTPKDQDCKNDYREARRMENELNQFIKYSSKKGTDTAELSQSLATVQQAREKLQSCSSLTWEELESVRKTLMGGNGIQKKLDVFRCQNEYERSKKDQERMKKDMERSREHLEKMKKMLSSGEMKEKIENQMKRMEKMIEIQAKRLGLMESTNCKLWTGYTMDEDGSEEDYTDQRMEWEDLNYEMQDLSYEMDSFWTEFESVQETAWASQMFDEVDREIQKAYERDYPRMPREIQIKFDMLASTAKELTKKGRECQAAGDTKCVEEIKNRLDEIAMKGAQLFGAPEVDFREYGFDDTMNENFKQTSQNMNYSEANEVINYLLSLDPTLASKITDPAMADKIFRIMGRIPENIKTEYLNDIGKLKETFDQAVQVAPELKNYKDQILGYNYFGDGLNGVLAGLEAVRDGQITVSDLTAKLDSFKNTSKKAEVEIGITKFEDATTDKWYYDAANKEEFNIAGRNIKGKQVFDASGTTTYAEMLKVLSEGMGIQQVEGNTSYGAANNHWAKGYYKAIEGSGVTLMDPNHKITRGEMARMVVEMIKLPVQNGETRFSDLKGNKYESYISTLYSYGVIHGDSNSDTVRPNDTINRAEAFTLAKNALENLQYATISESEMNTYTEDLDTMGE